MQLFSVADECREYFNENLSQDDLDASVKVWDTCGHEVYHTYKCMYKKTQVLSRTPV